MARLWSCGFESNSITADMEITSTAGTGTKEVQATTKRSGGYAFRASTTANLANGTYQYRSGNTQEDVLYRAYVRITAAPSVQTHILGFRSSGSNRIGIRLGTDMKLQLYNIEDSAQIGGDSPALSTGVWHRIEVNINTVTLASTSCVARLDGVTFATDTVSLAGALCQMVFGVIITNATLEIFFDDLAINDSSGSSQTNYPGEGRIIRLRPDADGDTTDGTRGGSDTGADWSQTSEVTPDGASTYMNLSVINEVFEVNLDASSIPSESVINCVQLGYRVAGAGTGTYTFSPRIKSQSAGTLVEGASTLAGTTYHTNDDADPRNPVLTSYTDPQAGGVWTAALLGTAQIGIKATDVTPNIRLSTIWLDVDYRNAYSLTADKGDFALNGQAAGLQRGLVVGADYGSFTFTGQSADLIYSGGTGYELTADVGQFALNGQNADLLHGYVVGADQESFLLNGQDAGLYRGYVIISDKGDYLLNGQDAELLRGYLIGSDFGSYSLSGQDAALLFGRLLNSDAGSYSLTGQDAALLVARVLEAINGGYNLNGQATGLFKGAGMIAVVGNFSVNGQDVTFEVIEAFIPRVNYF